MLCSHCGNPLKHEDDLFCSECGAMIAREESVHPDVEADSAEQTPPPEDQPTQPVKKKKKIWLVLLLIVLAVLLLPVVLVVLAVLVLAIVLVVTRLLTTAPKAVTPVEPSTMTTAPYIADVPSEEYPIEIITTTTYTTAATEAAVLMPSVEGDDADDAKLRLEEMGFTVVLTQAYSDMAQNSIITQSPSAGTAMHRGDTVVLTVSEGPVFQQTVVVAASSGSSYGTMTLYNWEDGQWEVQFSCEASVGQNGIGADYGEGKGLSPQGVFRIGKAFAASGVETYDWPTQRVTLDTCIVDDVNSEYYNTVQSISSLPEGVHYDTIGNTLINGFSEVCIFIEHNGNGFTSDGVVAGKGSVITICSKSSALEPTAGCVDISTADMNVLLRALDPAKNPHIEFTVQ